MHTKIGLHAFDINLYLYEYFELILFFDPMDTIQVHKQVGTCTEMYMCVSVCHYKHQ